MHLLVISPQLVMEVEARMRRNYMPSMLPQHKHSRQSAKPHLPTVQELQGMYDPLTANSGTRNCKHQIHNLQFRVRNFCACFLNLANHFFYILVRKIP